MEIDHSSNITSSGMSKEISREFVKIFAKIIMTNERMRVLYHLARRNRLICGNLVSRVDSVKYKLYHVMELKMNKDTGFYSQENYFTMQKLLANLEKIKEFIDDLSHSRKHFTNKSVHTYYELINEMDSYVETLNAKINVNMNSKGKSLLQEIEETEIEEAEIEESEKFINSIPEKKKLDTIESIKSSCNNTSSTYLNLSCQLNYSVRESSGFSN
ncbi:16862_t:CDS:2 [Acaulospora morrowiae]|uniref:16862_t:CDS:1 n=1 Tax=Acaulospora morrowiae TaxID=94023 RepID=A0A9N9FLW8_9GLOM|nr:16862_t:CDS:2 [Acaulospora morrowiae]